MLVSVSELMWWLLNYIHVLELLCLCLTAQCLKLTFHWVLVMFMSFSELL